MIELNKIYNENCIDTMDRMSDDSIDLVVTSPPYDNLRSYNNESSWNFDTFKKIADGLYRVMKPGGVIVWVVADSTINGSETGTSFRQALYFNEIGFNIHDTMIYEKRNYVPLTHNRYEQCFEYMFVLSKGKPKTFNPIMIECKTAGSTNNHKSEKQYETSYSMRKVDGEVVVKDMKIHPNKFIYTVGAGDKTTHNAPFPEQLAIDQVASWSNEADVVYDPFMGAGTTAKAAILLDRKYIGSEISKTYFDAINLRIDTVEEIIEEKKSYENDISDIFEF